MQWNDFGRHLQGLTASDQERVRRAFEMGKEAHDGQMRKSGEPYFTHPIAIAERLAGMGADADTIIAALLHDTIEDTTVTLEKVRKEFGPDVATIIDGVTKLTASDLTSPSHDEQIETLRKVFTLMQQDVRIMIVKLVDRWHNMLTVGGLPPERQRSFAQETLDTIVKIADRLCLQDLREELAGQSLAVLEPDLFKKLQNLAKENQKIGATIVAGIQQKLAAVLPANTTIHAEALSWEKLRTFYHLGSASGMAQINAVFICPSIDACYTVLGIIHQNWGLQRLTFDDYINAPAINGYRGIHTTIILPDGRRVRCKMRTKAMDAYAHRGVTTNCFGPRDKHHPSHALAWTERISPLAEGTAFQSEAFWTGLQRDLLGTEIVVHGSKEESVTVPSGATALDAVFYLRGEDATRTESIRVNGEPATFDQPLSQGDVIDASYARDVQATREWLNYVESGLASTLIRQELARAPLEDKILLGQTLLDVGLRRHGWPGLSELNPKVFDEGLATLGLQSIDELLVQLAEGKIGVQQTLMVFTSALGYKTHSSRVWKLSISNEHGQDLDRWITWTRSLGPKSMFVQERNGHEVLQAVLTLSEEQVDSIETYLHSRLPNNDWMLQPRWQRPFTIISTMVLVLLWGLDPVFAHALLTQHMSVPALTIIRFTAFLAISIAAHLTLQHSNRGRLVNIPVHSTPLIVSGLALFVTSVASYAALKSVSPTIYILAIVAGVLGTAILRSLSRRESTLGPILAMAVVMVSIGAALVFSPPTLYGVAAAILGSIAFATYSAASYRYQQTINIRTRYPTFLLWVSSIGLLCSFVLLPLTPLASLTVTQIWQGIGFVCIFAVLPYILYFEIMRRTDSRFLDRLLPLVIISTVCGDLLLNESLWPLIGLPAMLGVGWLLYRYERRQRP